MTNESDAQQKAWEAYDAARRNDPGEKQQSTKILRSAWQSAKAVREGKSK